MKNSKALFLDLVKRIELKEHRDEIESIAYLLLENLMALSRSDIQAEKKVAISTVEDRALTNMLQRINTDEPLQYILGTAPFYGRNFEVDSSTLIPRPETEELVRAVLSYTMGLKKNDRLRILDVGTGSGCIAITLGLEEPRADITATDVDKACLSVAARNARQLNVNVQFLLHNILTEKIAITGLDVVVSNPPYVTESEKQLIQKNVIGFEPHTALFVPNEDPLRFYHAITERAARALRSSGLLAFEINARFGLQVAHCMEVSGFKQVEIAKDIFGKERIVKGILS